MRYNPYGPQGIIWSGEEPTPWIDPKRQYINMALAGSLAGGIGLALTQTKSGGTGYRALDYVQSAVRHVAESTPAGIGNTFRLPEFLSPYISAKGQGLTIAESVAGHGPVGVYNVGPEYLKTKETKEFLKAVVGEQAFAGAGLHELGAGSAFELRYERNLKKSSGGLFVRKLERDVVSDTFKPVVGGNKGWNLLAKDISLFETTAGPGHVIPRDRLIRQPKINEAFYGVVQQLGIAGNMSPTQAQRILAEVDGEQELVSRLKYAFMPSVTGPIGSPADLARRATYGGSIAAWGIQRFNRLLETTGEQIPFLGEAGNKFAKATGLSLKIQPGQAHKMFARFGLQAAKIGAAWTGLRQLDHYRREFELPGNVLASGAVSAASSALLLKTGLLKSPGAANMWAVGSFFGQLVLPGWEQGVVEGAASTFTNMSVLRSYIGKFSGMSTLRRSIEGFTPGFTDWTTGVFLGLGTAAVSYSGLSEKIFEKAVSATITGKGGLLPSGIRNRVGFLPSGTDLVQPKRLGQFYIQELEAMAMSDATELLTSKEMQASKQVTGHIKSPWQVIVGSEAEKEFNEILTRTKGPWKAARLRNFLLKRAALNGGAEGVNTALVEMSARHDRALLRRKDAYIRDNAVNKSLLNRVENIVTRYSTESEGKTTKLLRGFEIGAAKLYHAFFGASMPSGVMEQALAKVAEVPSHSFEQQLKALGVKKGFGRGGTIVAGVFGLHQLATGALFGTMEDPEELRDIYAGRKYVPVQRGRWWEAGGTPYEGHETAYFRPHWYTLMMNRAEEKAAWGEDPPSPIAQFFYENFTYELERRTYYERPYPHTSAAFQNVPIIGGILGATIGQLIKPTRFMHTSEFLRSTSEGGIEHAFEPERHGPVPHLGGKPIGTPVSGTSPAYAAAEAHYKFRELEGLSGWAKNMMQKSLTGGAETFGLHDPVYGSAASITSPIERFWDMNVGGALLMSEPIRRFLPRPRSEINEYNPILNRMPSWVPDRFHYGDPYRKLEAGYARLPGAGYAAVHPELKGVSAEGYPLIHKYTILADIAPESRKFSEIRDQVYQARIEGLTNELQNNHIDMIDNLVSKKMVKRQFTHHPNAIELPGSELAQMGYGAATSFIRGVVAPAEYMIPMGFRPAQKLFAHDRGMIEQYEYERLYGTTNAFWDKPWRDWFRPAIWSAANMMGYDSKPFHRQEEDELGEYFDKLEFSKWMKLAENANSNKERQSYLRQAQKTRYGVNPRGDAMSVYSALPDSEKKFFDAFSFATNKDRERILEMVPQDMAHLYKAVWKRVDQGDKSLYPGSPTQINDQHLAGRFNDLQEYFHDNPLPSSDWIGWHEDVEVDDIKLKYVENLGKDIHDFGHWQKQQRALARKPYLDGADSFLWEGSGPTRNDIGRELYHMSRGDTNRIPLEFNVNSLPGGFSNQSYARLYYNDTRHSEIIDLISNAY